VTSSKNTAPLSQPLAKADSSQQLKATGFVTALPFPTYEVGAEQFRFQTTAPLADSPPRLALLCTFLI
jgi:EamA domain-containing membrane protein RarD